MKAKPLDLSASALTGALCVVWGFNQVVAKLALPDVGPIMQTGVRSAIGAICVVAFALVTNRRVFKLDGTEAAGALAGVLFTGEFIALYELLRFTTAARATVFVYAAPFFVAFGAAFLLKDERLRPIQWAGLGLAFLGVACGMAGRTPGGALAGDALALLAAALWGATTLVIKATPLKRADPLKVLLYQIGAAALIAPAAAYAFGEPAPVHLSGAAIASLLWQGVAVVGVSYALWFWVLTRYVVAQLSAFTFISPLVGVFAGWLVFGETITAAFALAIALVLAGLALVNWPRRRARALAALRLERLAEPPGEILDELPGRAPGARAARRRPFERFGFELARRRLEAEMPGVTVDHGEVIVLAAMVEAEPEAEPVGERHLLLDRLARIDGASALVLHHVARQKVAPVRGRVEEHVPRAPFDPALERRFERLVGRVAGVERKIVAKDDEPISRVAQEAHQRGQALDVLAMDLDQFRGAPRPRSFG